MYNPGISQEAGYDTRYGWSIIENIHFMPKLAKATSVFSDLVVGKPELDG
jgi:hypothetical protein